MKNVGDLLLKQTSKKTALLLLILFTAIFFTLIYSSHTAWAHFGLGFVGSLKWNPIAHQFSALSAIVGTLVTAFIAIIIALPLSLLVAVFIEYMTPLKLRFPLTIAIQLLAGIPSIIFGMWGLFILAPILSQYVQPMLTDTLGKIPYFGLLFQGPNLGIGVFAAGIILAIMIIPLLCTMMLDLFRKVPKTLTESAYAMGLTRFEVIRKIYLPYLRSGLLGSTILGLGRALGETMAVTFVIGNSHILSSSLYMPGNTIASTIANEFTEAVGKLYSSSLLALAVILMVITFGTIIIARLLLRKYNANEK